MKFSSYFLPVFGLLAMTLPLVSAASHEIFFHSTFVSALYLLVFLGLGWGAVRQFGAGVVLAVLLGVIVLQAQWGLFQFVVQRDLGMYLLGETRLEVSGPGIAKFAVPEGRLIRGYGPYPHANNFGGAMMVGIVCAMMLASATSPALRKSETFFLAVTFFLFLGLLVSFSRAAYAGAGLALIFGWFFVTRRVKHWLTPLLISLLVFMPLLMSRASDGADVAVSERLLGYRWAFEIINGQGLWQGAGLGNYEEVLRFFLVRSSTEFEEWQVAPVHSVPLLLAVEAGIIPTLLLIGGLGCGILHLWLRRGRRWMGMTLLSILPLALFDYYLLREIAPAGYVVLLLVGAKAWYSGRQDESIYRKG